MQLAIEKTIIKTMIIINKGYIMLILLFITAISCSKEKTALYQEVFEVELVSNWSKTTHPTDFPSNAHFSPMIGLSHLAGVDVINVGLTATKGVKSMAETGSTTLLIKEFDALHVQTYSLDTLVGKGFSSPGSNKAEIGVEKGRHMVSIFSMIAPSPDWFVAASVSLIDPIDGKWYDEIIVHATAYDAGTDSGESFTSPNSPSDSTIQRIQNGPLTEGNDTVNNIAKFIFRRVKK